MKIVITYGTFDLFHVGHLNILKRAKALGDYLIVGLSTDEFNRDAKSKYTVISYEDRKEILESLKFVDLVIPEENWEQKVKDIQEYKVDTFVMGHDWDGKFDELKEYCEVVYLPRTEAISSSDLKKHIASTPHKRFERTETV
ncbi:glycerol-3-phosphate cytidylyltransferase [Acinetobacter sp. 187]|uniref:glycerol-3-phosphate cytidylyltransferase n=1 Tax=Acinetobacter lanii TaxID=2715163 RepID=UPI00140DC6A8|nr:glycerol-3-phosphate cytidylyltransferase [Acinetobacter lanii]NHC03361.1 glycerol-3-phosphate cytidylyltransferase [Acinetobacter lanii]